MKNENLTSAAEQSLAVSVGALTLTSPLMNASGAFNPEVFGRCFPLQEHMGAVVMKTLTPEASKGNLQQRTVALPSLGMLNSIGLQGKGITAGLRAELPQWSETGVPVVFSVSASSVEAFEAAIITVFAHPAAVESIHAVELNLSCPNVHAGGSVFGSSPTWVKAVVAAVKAVCPVPVWVKLTPNVTSVLPIAEEAITAGADALVAINTVLAAHVDVRRKKASLSRVSGGYSGVGMKPIALHHILQLAQAFPHYPIVGVGGIETTEDVLAFLMAGCCAVQIGTQAFRQPWVFPSVTKGLQAYMKQEGISTLKPIMGCAVPVVRR
jgi:dihydroorotate dehydrogenase (NAD+) catalytic subunit